jgi:outer membrane protein TolC
MASLSNGVPAGQEAMVEDASAEMPAPSDESYERRERPQYGSVEQLPIDLPTVIELIDRDSPTIGIARARVREAHARLQLAELQWIPNLTVGVAYNRFDGQTQNQRGDVFSVSRSNLFGGGGPALALDTAEAYYRPLIEKRLLSAERLRTQSVAARTELDGVTAYLDLVQLHATKLINEEILQRSQEMLVAAKNAREAKLDRSAGDVHRAQTEVLVRRAERIEIEAKILAASARLAGLLSLAPCVRLTPVDSPLVPMELIDASTTLDQLVQSALSSRPDLASNRQLLAAAWERVRRQENGMRYPKIMLGDQFGTYGGGTNADLGQFDSRNVIGVQLLWEIKNLGLGNQTETLERRAVAEQARQQVLESQTRAIAEIVEVAHLAAAKYEVIDLAEQAVAESMELYRINKEGTLNVVDAKNLFDALRPLQSIQILNQSKVNYLSAVIEFNKAQFRLYTLVGQDSRRAIGRVENGE